MHDEEGLLSGKGVPKGKGKGFKGKGKGKGKGGTKGKGGKEQRALVHNRGFSSEEIDAPLAPDRKGPSFRKKASKRESEFSDMDEDMDAMVNAL